MPVLSRLIIKPRSGTRRMARQAPTGRPKMVASTRAVPETSRDNRIMRHSSGLKVMMSRKAAANPSMMDCIEN